MNGWRAAMQTVPTTPRYGFRLISTAMRARTGLKASAHTSSRSFAETGQMSRFPARTARPRRVHACMSETMPPPVDPAVHRAVQTVYTTDLGLPEEWTEAQRADFIDAEVDKITWMARADAGDRKSVV